MDGRIPAPPGMVESLSIIMVKPSISGAGFRSHPPLNNSIKRLKPWTCFHHLHFAPGLGGRPEGDGERMDM